MSAVWPTPVYERKVGDGNYALDARIPGYMGTRRRVGFQNSADAVNHARLRLGSKRFQVTRLSDQTVVFSEGLQ